MKNIINFIYFLKTSFHGLFNLFRLIVSGNFFKYLKTEKEIIELVTSKKIDKILLITGGKSLFNYWDRISEYDYIAVNSFNTLKMLNETRKEEIKDKIIIYYQAPFHKPLNATEFDKDIQQTIDYLTIDCIKIYNKAKDSLFRVNMNSVNFRPYGYLNYFGFKLSSSTGALFLLSVLLKSEIKKVDVLGFDVNWISDASFIKSQNSDLMGSLLWSYEIYYQIRMFKRSIKMDKNRYSILNPESWINLIK